jgi:hypothetical protein
MDVLLQKLDAERKRANFIETQNRSLIGQLENSDKRTADAASAAAELRAALARKEDAAAEAQAQLIEAEVRIAEAEARVNVALADTAHVVETVEGEKEQLIADKFAVEDELDKLRTKVLTVEATIMADWDSDRVEQAHLREKLNDIASEVSRLVYAVEGEIPDNDDTLLQRVQKYTDEDLSTTRSPEPRAPEPVGQSAVSDRLAALRDIQSRN